MGALVPGAEEHQRQRRDDGGDGGDARKAAARGAEELRAGAEGGLGGHQREGLGRAVQVDPIKPTLNAPGPKPLKLKCDKLLSTCAFKSNLRRFNLELKRLKAAERLEAEKERARQGLASIAIACHVIQVTLKPRCLE